MFTSEQRKQIGETYDEIYDSQVGKWILNLNKNTRICFTIFYLKM
jgi:hypothetical protein